MLASMRPAQKAPENRERPVHEADVGIRFNEAGAKSAGKRAEIDERAAEPDLLQ